MCVFMIFQAIKMLTEMGFGEEEVINALRHHGNGQQEAVSRALWVKHNNAFL